MYLKADILGVCIIYSYLQYHILQFALACWQEAIKLQMLYTK